MRLAFTSAVLVAAVMYMIPFGNPSMLWKLIMINLAVCCDKPTHASVFILSVMLVMFFQDLADWQSIGFLTWSTILLSKGYISQQVVGGSFIPMKELVAYEQHDVDAIISGSSQLEEE
eukprot:TRINITY_DN5052_c0_g1_i2.p1 TRINITY_DN5052_c0_g1~~TRINITY_DN5052_c0_g1_i2.p1  ORF type:complete len:118 (+),score=22.15 TRINITY_DN5052_c0_g1_i2:259-612(+)